MKEISQNPIYIKILTYVENWKGDKVYATHCISINEKFMKDDVKRFMNFVMTQFPNLLSVELIENENYGKR